MTENGGIPMEDKKVLSNKELENISSGTVKSGSTCRLYCMNCNTCIEDDVPLEIAETFKQLYETKHNCPSGKGPRLVIRYS